MAIYMTESSTTKHQGQLLCDRAPKAGMKPCFETILKKSVPLRSRLCRKVSRKPSTSKIWPTSLRTFAGGSRDGSRYLQQTDSVPIEHFLDGARIRNEPPDRGQLLRAAAAFSGTGSIVTIASIQQPILMPI